MRYRFQGSVGSLSQVGRAVQLRIRQHPTCSFPRDRLRAEEATDVLTQVTSAAGRWRAAAATHGLQQADINAIEPAFENAERKRAQALKTKRPR
jgi:hypothetical protein